ncbi:hypothetical protein R3P38DRAFT_1837272 [Favolaschia claudopus]|uniref:Uncharacterized protein n=1 Tax=Favolaschia claudopus TaxID=2862362 RepID=A0AAW0A329_9AGAR
MLLNRGFPKSHLILSKTRSLSTVEATTIRLFRRRRQSNNCSEWLWDQGGGRRPEESLPTYTLPVLRGRRFFLRPLVQSTQLGIIQLAKQAGMKVLSSAGSGERSLITGRSLHVSFLRKRELTCTPSNHQNLNYLDLTSSNIQILGSRDIINAAIEYCSGARILAVGFPIKSLKLMSTVRSITDVHNGILCGAPRALFIQPLFYSI